MRSKVGFFLSFFALMALGQANLNSNLIQPAQHIEGSTISFSSGVYTVPNSQWAKALEYRDSAATGNIFVHLVLDRATTWTRYCVRGGDVRLMMFDKIRQSGTTINLDSLLLYTTTNQ
jgi:hypothetical protein